MKEISRRSAVVTGAGGGIGRSIALALADAGANVVVSDIELDVAEAVAKEVRARGVRALAVKTDVSQLKEVEALADAAYREFGSIEILVNNAGVTLRPFRASWDTSIEDFQWIMGVNFWGVLHGHHVFVPRMRKSPGEKHIVNTSSIASLLSVAGHSAYAASKYAVDGFSHAAREELKTQNIGVTILHPGAVRTRIVTSERLRKVEDRSETRHVKPWTDYVQQTGNAVIDRAAEAPDPSTDPDFASNPMQYITPNAIGGMVVEAIKANRPHVLTHPALPDVFRARIEEIIASAPPVPK
jgi:NAD(P)-dependent dehydrogenase (short-subunit alcohol dehydrogenase family)